MVTLAHNRVVLKKYFKNRQPQKKDYEHRYAKSSDVVIR